MLFRAAFLNAVTSSSKSRLNIAGFFGMMVAEVENSVFVPSPLFSFPGYSEAKGQENGWFESPQQSLLQCSSATYIA
jgi:hypothetical protein